MSESIEPATDEARRTAAGDTVQPAEQAWDHWATGDDALNKSLEATYGALRASHEGKDVDAVTVPVSLVLEALWCMSRTAHRAEQYRAALQAPQP